MTIQERIEQSEARFNELSKQRDDINMEMTKLQGEWRVLKELLDEQESKGNKSRVNKTKADTVEVVPEGLVA